MDRFWCEMARRGAQSYWEIFDFRSPDGLWSHKLSSTCHGWSDGIVPLLHKYALGVTFTKPGGREIKVRPHPGPLRQAEGVVPTIHGPVHMRWERSGKR